MALCPAHEDRRKSLSIGLGNDGRVLLRCFAGCSFNSIVAAVGLKPRHLFPQRQYKNPQYWSVKEKPEKTYTYHDAHGKPLHLTLRFPGKVFKQGLPDGKGGYTLGLNGVDTVIYNLPFVLKAKEVFILEGERDSDSINSLGLCGTCNPMGAGKWKESYNQYFPGKAVIIIPDADEPGRRHAEQVALSLHGIASSIKVLELPAGTGKDFSDWLLKQADQDIALERLSLLVEDCLEWHPPALSAPDCHADADKSFNLTDLGNAERFIRMHDTNVRYCPAWKKWLIWSGSRWQIDSSLEIYRLGKETVRSIYREASEETDETTRKKIDEHARKSESQSRIAAMLSLAESEAPIAPDALDSNPFLLACPNGTIDLSSGQLRKHDPNDYITKISPVEFNPDAQCPLWNTFLDRIFSGNTSLISFLQRAVGYSLTGSTCEEVLFFLYGTGSNGKSKFIETIRALLGDYARQTDFETFLVKNSDGVRNDVAALLGSRFVSSIETESGRRLAECLIKQLTGGDTISARKLYSEFFEFKPTFKVWFAANHKPIIRGTDWGIWRRIRLIPFSVTIPENERDRNLFEKLKNQLPGILNWALKGCLDWQKFGLGMPEEVRTATQEYREESDILADFIANYCILDEELRISAKDLYSGYRSWCEANEEQPVKQRTFGLRLSERGLEKRRGGTGGNIYWHGIDLLPESVKQAVSNY